MGKSLRLTFLSHSVDMYMLQDGVTPFEKLFYAVSFQEVVNNNSV